jgi:hypothetical protein
MRAIPYGMAVAALGIITAIRGCATTANNSGQVAAS